MGLPKALALNLIYYGFQQLFFLALHFLESNSLHFAIWFIPTSYT